VGSQRRELGLGSCSPTCSFISMVARISSGDLQGGCWFGLVWFGLVWFGLVLFGLVWFGLVWFGLVWFGVRHGMAWGGEVWHTVGQVWKTVCW